MPSIKFSFSPYILFFCAFSWAIHTYAANDSMSFQGYSGLFNIPNAEVLSYGQGLVQYSNQLLLDDEVRDYNNLVVNFGLFPHVEVGGRIAWGTTHRNIYEEEKDGPRDLSANVKIHVPFIPKEWFSLAIGEQDVGGAASHFDARYVVAGRNFGPVRIDMGMGQNQSSERLSGFFGGIEYQPVPWASLIAEHDGLNTNMGFRLNAARQIDSGLLKAELTVLAKTDNVTGKDEQFYGLAIHFPLGRSYSTAASKREPPKQQSLFESIPQHVGVKKDTLDKPPSLPTLTNAKSSLPVYSVSKLKALADKLSAYGFERIAVAKQDETLFISLENNVFNRNELDAIGLVLGTAAVHADENYENISFNLKNQGITVLNLKVNAQEYRAFLQTSSVRPSIQISYQADAIPVNAQQPSHYLPSWKPRITLAPVIVSGVATEYGVWDYSWAIQSNVSFSLWPGAVISANHNTFMGQSSDFDAGGVFESVSVPAGIVEYSIQQGFKFSDNWMNNVHIGRIRNNYDGAQLETLWSSDQGLHQLGGRAASYQNVEDSSDSRDVYLGRYRYYNPTYDITVELNAGQFWAQDQGVRIASKFRFGDHSVTLLAKKTEASFIGIVWSMPLTLRRDYNARYLQIKGKESWSYGIQTRVNEWHNSVSFSVADVPSFEWEINRSYFNNDRLSKQYLQQNSERLKQAYKQYH